MDILIINVFLKEGSPGLKSLITFKKHYQGKENILHSNLNKKHSFALIHNSCHLFMPSLSDL